MSKLVRVVAVIEMTVPEEKISRSDKEMFASATDVTQAIVYPKEKGEVYKLFWLQKPNETKCYKRKNILQKIVFGLHKIDGLLGK